MKNYTRKTRAGGTLIRVIYPYFLITMPLVLCVFMRDLRSIALGIILALLFGWLKQKEWQKVLEGKFPITERDAIAEREMQNGKRYVRIINNHQVHAQIISLPCELITEYRVHE